MFELRSTIIFKLLVAHAPILAAQEASKSAKNASSSEVAADSGEAFLTKAELKNFVARVALFPDTVLTQIPITATLPLDIVKAEKLSADSQEKEIKEVTALIEAEGYDDSVEVLAIGYPEVNSTMSVNIDWTESAGLAMLAQTEDIMAAV